MSKLKYPENIIELIQDLKSKNINESEFGFHIDRFLESKARRLKVPLTGTFELTPLCNLDCKMCYVHLAGSEFDNSKLMSVDKWKDLMRQARELGMIRANLTGGECLTYPGFDEIYLFLYRMNIAPAILTNGILMNEKRIEFLKRYPPRVIQISLYGSSEDAYEKVTGHRVFRIVYQNICKIQKAGLPLKIAITPNEFMHGDLRELLETVIDLKIPYTINPRLVTPRQNTGRQKHDLTVDQYVEFFRIRREMNHSLLAPVDPEELPDANREAVRNYGLHCGAGRSCFGIQSNGNMLPCLSMEELSTFPLRDGFKNAWNQMIQLVESYQRPGECDTCFYFERCLHCVALHKNAPKGHCDPQVCERTKKLISAGYIPMPGQ